MTTGQYEAVHDVEATDGPAVVVETLSRSFGDVSVLDRVSFSIDPGTVACLVGPNGSGKTTLLRIVAGLLSPDEGRVAVPEGDRAVGYLAQQPAFRPQFTIRETLSFYASLVDGESDVQGLVDRVGLGPVADRRVRALSGGMLRLLGLAQTAIGNPPLLVFDEPSSGLDPMMTRHITDVISELGRAGNAVLLATHDLRSVERVADEVLVLGQGTLVATGTPEELLEETTTGTLEDALVELTAGDEVAVAAGRRRGDRE
jgi:ABC-type multidrug transport system ATPase subunit